MLVDKKALPHLERLFQQYYAVACNTEQLRPRFERIDKYIQREIDYTEEGRKAKVVNQAGNRKVVPNQEVPVVLSQVDTAHAYLVGALLQGYPFFGVGSDQRNLQDIGVQLNMLSGRDQRRFNYATNLGSCFRDGIKYNLMAAEVAWTKKHSSGVVNYTQSGKRTTGQVKKVIYEGNQIKRLDPYNVFWDNSVPPNMVHEDGAFVGYFELFNYVRVKAFLANLDTLPAIHKNFSRALDNAQFVEQVGRFYTPKVRQPDDNVEYDPHNFVGFFGPESVNRRQNCQSGLYQVITMYCRLIPREYGVRGQNDGTPTIYKLIWIGNVLVYAEPMDIAHAYLPIILCTPNDDGLGLQSKSLAENVMALQDTTTSLLNGTLASMRRAVSDRGLYDSTKVRKEDIENLNPTAKIPVRLGQNQKDLQSVYYPIPFEDRASGLFNQNLNTVMGLVQLTTGINQASQGNFVKGNKTLHEFDMIMSKSDARMQKYAMDIESVWLTPIKNICKLNWLTYAVKEQIPDPTTGRMVDINPEELRERELEFVVSDGLLPAAKLLNTDVVIQALNTIQTHPQLSMEYDTGGMIVGLLKNQGMDLSQYKRTPEEMNAYAQQLAVANGTAQSAGGQQAGEGQPPQ